MKRNIKPLTIVLCLLSLLNLTAYSQTTVLSKTGDTLVCFTVDQSKFLLKQVYEVRKYKELDSIHKLQHALCDSLHESNQNIILDQGEIINNQKEIIELKDYQIKKLTDQLEIERKATRRQKFYKWVAIIVGSGATGFMTLKYVTK